MKVVTLTKRGDYRYIQEEPQIDIMGKLRREVEFIEKGMHRVRTKLQKLQPDPPLTPSMSVVGLRPKQFVDQHDYHIMELGKVQDSHDNDGYIGLYSTIEQHIRADAISSRKIYEEE